MIKKCLLYLFFVVLIPQISYASDVTEIDRKINAELKKLSDIHFNLKDSDRYFYGRMNELEQSIIDDNTLFSTPYSRYYYIVQKLSSVDGVILNDIDFLRISSLIKDQYKTLYYSFAVKRLKEPQKVEFSDLTFKVIKSMTKNQEEIKHIDLIIDKLNLINNIYSELINLLQIEMKKTVAKTGSKLKN